MDSVADEIVKLRRAFESVTPDHVPEYYFSAHGALEDPNGEPKGDVFGIVMQYVDGGSLAQVLSKGPIPYWIGDPVMQDMLYALCMLGEAMSARGGEVGQCRRTLQSGSGCFLDYAAIRRAQRPNS